MQDTSILMASESSTVTTEPDNLKHEFDNLSLERDDETYVLPKHLLFPQRSFKKHQNKFLALARWEGMIINIKGNNVFSKVRDIDHPGNEEYFEFDKEEVIEEDQDLIQQGAFFYWSVGYEVLNGMRKKASIIKFKRKAVVDQNQLSDIENASAQLKNDIIWE